MLRAPSPRQGLTEVIRELGLEPGWAPLVTRPPHSVRLRIYLQDPKGAGAWFRLLLGRGGGNRVGWVTQRRQRPSPHMFLALRCPPYICPASTRLPTALPRQREFFPKSVCAFPFREAQEGRPCALVKNKGRSCAQEPMGPSHQARGSGVTFPECPVTLGPICSISAIICSGASRAELREGRVEAFLQLGRLMAALQGSTLPKCPGRWGREEQRVGILGSGRDSVPFLPSLAGRRLPSPAYP